MFADLYVQGCPGTNSQTVFSMLQKQINSKVEHAFSLNFEHVATIGKACPNNNWPSTLFGTKSTELSDYEFRKLGDVKISHACSVIIVCDCESNRILFYDLNTHQHKRTLHTFDIPYCLAIECSDNGCDFLYYSSEYFVYKYNLDQLIRGECSGPVWKSGEFSFNLLSRQGYRKPRLNQFQHAKGLVVCHPKKVLPSGTEFDGNVLLVCHPTQFEVKMVMCTTGQVIGTFKVRTSGLSKKEGGGPVRIDVNSEGNLIIVDRGLRLYGKKGNGMVELQSFGAGLEFQRPHGVVVDKVNGNVILCDCGNNRMVVLDENGTFIKEFKEDSEWHPNGVCIDVRTGYLYIADSKRIQVYK